MSQLDGRSYQWRSDRVVTLEPKGPDEPHQPGRADRVLGFIAQDLRRIVPECVSEDPYTGILSVSYTDIVPVLIEAIKAHQRQVSASAAAFTYEMDRMDQEMTQASKSIKKTLIRLRKIRQKRQQDIGNGAQTIALPPERKKRPKSRFNSVKVPSKPCLILSGLVIAAVAALAVLLALLIPRSAILPPPPPVGTPNAAPPPFKFNPLIVVFGSAGDSTASPGTISVVTGGLPYFYDDVDRRFEQVNNASLYFEAGQAASRLEIMPETAQSTFYRPSTFTATFLLESYINFTTGFTNASSGVVGLNISMWVNWIYAADPENPDPDQRTVQTIWLQYDAYDTFASQLPSSTAISYVDNITPGAYRGWRRWFTVLPVRPGKFPFKADISIKSTLVGSVIVDDLQTQIIRSDAAGEISRILN